ncbi:hypothetical protein [Teichococcus oryzae]|uniref:YfhO family protein n=1 Tax=Teichococcus oryzae TaxID=1608942 RepID=A0A5B2TJA7_9PROT|nr:hypothetical protein [Pseudoroseomonas oryzae]KAA2214163.1 hypothetical protein F0Q34_00010 [Pseudoroseomonas oryzae]
MRPFVGMTRGALVALAGLLLLTPMMLSPMPSLGDFANHAARFWLLGGGIGQMPDVYGADWTRAFINIGGDLLARFFAGIATGDQVGQAILAIAIIGPPFGLLLLNKRLLGWNVWMFAFPFLAWTQTLLFGFITFQMGMGLALIMAAIDTSLPEGRGRWLYRLGCAALLLVVHPFALLFYAALTGGLILGPRLLDHLASRPAFLRFLRQGLLLVAVCALPLLVLTLTAAHLPGEDQHSEGSQIIWMEGMNRVAALISPIRNYSRRFDIVITGLLALVPLYALVRRRLSLHQGLFAAAVILGIASLFMPKAMAGTVVLEVRLPLMALLAFAASLRIEMPTRREAMAAAAILALLGTVRTGDVARHWARAGQDVAALREVMEKLPPGSTVLPLQHNPSAEAIRQAPLGRYFLDDHPLFTHIASYAVIWRQAFIPNLFAARGKQPLLVLPPFNEISVPEGDLASIHVLDRPDYPVIGSQAYALKWRDRFDYVLVVNADLPDREGPLVLPEGVDKVADTGFAQLLRLPLAERPMAAR